MLTALVGSSAAFSPASLASRTVTTTRVVNSSPLSFPLFASPEEEEMQSDETKAEHELVSLDLSKTIYTSSMKSPKDSYVAFAEKGAANARMAKRKILHQSILGGCYVGFGALLSLSVAGNMAGIGGPNPGLAKMMFAALFPVNLLLIATTGGQLFTGNSATCVAARYEGLIDSYEMVRNLATSLVGNVIGCALMAFAANYMGLLTGGTAELCTKTALGKCTASFGKTFVKAILCNWMVSIAVFLSGASNDLAGKLVGVWFPISTFVAIGLEHSVANMFIMPAALLLKVPLTLGDVLFRNIVPVLLGNAVAGGLIVSGSYSYQFGRLGGKRRAIFAEQLAARDLRKRKDSIKKQADATIKSS